ncbi:MAG: hypothetical protein ACRDFB_10110, partial [Rhabdochlamydiaceae bacterium]
MAVRSASPNSDFERMTQRLDLMEKEIQKNKEDVSQKIALSNMQIQTQDLRLKKLEDQRATAIQDSILQGSSILLKAVVKVGGKEIAFQVGKLVSLEVA